MVTLPHVAHALQFGPHNAMRSVSLLRALRLSDKQPEGQDSQRDDARDGDQALLARARQADVDALGELYRRYASKVYAYVLFRVGSQELAEDLTSDVFVKMLDAVRLDNAWQTNYTGWLYRIAHNAIIDHFRRRANSPSVALGEQIVAADGNPVRTAEERARADDIGRALLQLTEDQQLVVVCKFYQGMSNLQIAQELHKTEGAIKSLQYRALGALRRLLGEAPEEADE